MSRFVVGIDLGTTNTALAYVDRQSGKWATKVRLFEVPQVVAPFEMRLRPLLPSFIYLVGPHDLPAGAVDLPFGDPRPDCVGVLARDHGAKVPGRLVSSSKSWLSHAQVDRRAAILPWNGAPDAPRLSPLHAAARILYHLRMAWDQLMGRGQERRFLSNQDVVITVPASFDAVARELTLEAARLAGLGDARLIEEPQAALYAWVAGHERELRERLPVGSVVLVVDVGGGTTDFTVVEVEAGEADEDVRLVRTAVSDHLLLGGDNLDLALAERVAPRLSGAGELRPLDWQALRHACRDAKERLLVDGEAAEPARPGAAPAAAPEPPPESLSVTIAGSGSRLIGGSRSAELTRAEVLDVSLGTFAPDVSFDKAVPERGAVTGALGLPLVRDPAITKHLAAFLRRHARPGERLLRPTAVLFNGGVMKSLRMRGQILDAIGRWTGERPPELIGAGFDLAVARGAAYYGLVRRKAGIRIWSGMARAYYLGLDTGGERPAALCLIPRGLEAERTVSVDPGLTLTMNTPIKLPLYASSSRSDALGAVIDDPAIETAEKEGDMQALPPLLTVLRSGRKRVSQARDLPVRLEAELTEVGGLKLACRAADDTDRSWELELSVRADVAIDGRDEEAAPLDDEQRAAVEAALADAFAPGASSEAQKGLGRALEAALDEAREGWSIPRCRAVWDLVVDHEAARVHSADHEARFWNLVAFTLRPGFGAALDDHRVQRVWKLALQGLRHPKSDAARLEWWILHRRVAGGLTRGHQEQVFGRIRESLLGNKRVPKQEGAELWRLAATLEHLGRKAKTRLGRKLFELLEAGKGPPQWGVWALGRLGARRPLYGPTHEVVAREVVESWVYALAPLLAKSHPRSRDRAVATLVQMGRLTGDPARDLEPRARYTLRDTLMKLGTAEERVRPLIEIVPPAPTEEQLVYGDSVPTGLQLRAAGAE